MNVEKSFEKVLTGYKTFRKKYASDDKSVMQSLSYNGQQPKIMVVACCDSRVDPALILQCEPGDLFVARNVANIVPPFEKDEAHHGTSAALEFGICHLNVEHLILLGHSQCGGIQAALSDDKNAHNDFISNWIALIKPQSRQNITVDDYAKLALASSYKNCLTFPWIKTRIEQQKLTIHLWFFDIKTGCIFTHSKSENAYQPLEVTES